MSGSATAAQVWVRRCALCERDDLRAAYGSAAIIDDGPWSCPVCGAARWVPVAVAFAGRR